MEHLSDRQLLDTLRQDAPAQPAVQEHLKHCESCRSRLHDFQQTWDVLGRWTVEQRQVDLTEGILKRARAGRTIYLWQPRTLLRIAAAIIVGVGIGSLSALPARRPISAQQVTDAMHLDVLAVNSATGWAGPLLTGEIGN